MESADMKNEMVSWFSELKDHQTPEWDSLPDLDLYMDQVITYLERQMRVFTQDGEDKLITPSMINNYVKNEIIPRPSKKKYSRDHLAYLLAISMLKQVLPITDISNIIKHQTGYMDMEEFYNRFRTIQDDTLHVTAQRVEEEILAEKNDSFNDRDALGMLAFKLTFEASSSILAAKKIIRMLTAEDKEHDDQEKDDKKKKNGSDSKSEKKKKNSHDNRDEKKENTDLM